jgi:DNA-binding response OmpR family regulator
MRLLLMAETRWVENEVRASLINPDDELTVLGRPMDLVNAVKDGSPDVVLVDMQVANMGAVAMTRSLRDAEALGQVPRVPVIMLLDRSADRFLVRRAGAEAGLVKPFTAQDLRAALAGLRADLPTDPMG